MTPAQASHDLNAALQGDWVGVLEYRDYSQPATSTKRVELPTWLHVAVTGEGTETWHYVYDDGPNKTVDETATIAFDATRGTYSAAENGKPAQVYQAAGYGLLKSGRGTLVLSGGGTDAGKAAEMRVTMTVGRNLMEVLQETRPAGSQEAFAFRHLYRFVRRDVPAVTGSR